MAHTDKTKPTRYQIEADPHAEVDHWCSEYGTVRVNRACDYDGTANPLHYCRLWSDNLTFARDKRIRVRNKRLNRAAKAESKNATHALTRDYYHGYDEDGMWNDYTDPAHNANAYYWD